MKILILDFLARWWWLLALYAVFTVILTAVGQPFTLTPLVLIVLLLDAQRGLFRAVRPLPVSRHNQALTWWLLSVFLLPLLSIPTLATGTAIYVSTHAALLVPVPSPTGGPPLHWLLDYSPWFAATVSAWIGLGMAAYCFVLCRFLPTRPANGALESTGQAFVGMLWGLSIPGTMMMTMFLPKTPAAVGPGFGVIFALVPVFVVLSYLVAPDVLQKRTLVLSMATKPVVRAPAGSDRHGLAGESLFFATIVGRGLMMVVLIGLTQLIAFSLMGGGDVMPRPGAMRNPAFAGQIIVFALVFASICGEWAGLRALRTLPLSTARLTALLLVGPCVLAIPAAVFSCGWGGVGSPTVPSLVNFVAQLLAIAGMGGLALAVSLHVASGLRILALLATAIVPTVGFVFVAKWPFALAFMGLVALAAGAALVHRGLRKSSAFYQVRRMFGISFGQPMAMR